MVGIDVQSLKHFLLQLLFFCITKTGRRKVQSATRQLGDNSFVISGGGGGAAACSGAGSAKCGLTCVKQVIGVRTTLTPDGLSSFFVLIHLQHYWRGGGAIEGAALSLFSHTDILTRHSCVSQHIVKQNGASDAEGHS